MGDSVHFATKNTDDLIRGEDESAADFLDRIAAANSGFNGFPFSVPLVEIWDGTTYFQGEADESASPAWIGSPRYPSSSSDEYRMVCGNKTDYPFGPLTHAEAVYLYWRIKSMDIPAGIVNGCYATESATSVSLATPAIPDAVDNDPPTPPFTEKSLVKSPRDKFSKLSFTEGSDYYYWWVWPEVGDGYWDSGPVYPEGEPDIGGPGGIGVDVVMYSRHVPTFVVTASDEYYMGYSFSINGLAGSGFALMDEESPEPESTIAIGETIHWCSPIYNHYGYALHSVEDIPFTKFFNIPDSDLTGEGVYASESSDNIFNFDYGTIVNAFYLTEGTITIQTPMVTISAPLYHLKASSRNINDWVGETQDIIIPTSITLIPDQFWAYKNKNEDDVFNTLTGEQINPIS